MTISENLRKEQAYAFEVYPKRDVVIVKGEGALLWDDQGNEYIDCTAGIGVANIGHANPVVAQALTIQANRLITCPGIFYSDTRAELMQKLISIAPDNLKTVFLCNSGTEAMEAAIKFARNTTGKQGIVSAMRGFHGRTLGALSATFKYRDEFEPLIPGHRFVPLNNIEKVQQAIDEDTACVILELVQGEGGVRPVDKSYVHQVRELCDRHNVLLLIDEIQTGFSRCGRMFACQAYDVQPDLMTVAKAMGGGVPIGAVLCSDKINSAQGKHGSTFGGNPLAAAAAIATIDYIQENDLAKQAEEKGEYLYKLLAENSSNKIREIRHLGLMFGIELKEKSKPHLLKLMEQGVLALPAGPTVIRLLPPLVISEAQLDRVAEAIGEVLA